MKEKKTFLQRVIATPYYVWAALFIVIPLALVAYYAFTDANGSFSFENIKMLWQANYRDVFIRSISYALIATVACLILAYPLAYLISQYSQRSQKTLILLVMLPMWMNILLRTYSWITILQPLGLMNTATAVIIGMIYNFLPYMIMPIYSVMTKMDKTVIEAAQDLGCNRMKVLSKIILPLSMPGVISGITMVFVPSISTFYISQKLGGGKFSLIGETIERQFLGTSNLNLGSAMSLVLMILIIICMAVMNKFTDSENGGDLIV